MRNVTIFSFVFILAGSFLATAVVFAVDTTAALPKQLSKQETIVLHGIENKLKQAISKKDFTLLKVMPQDKSHLTWNTCEQKSRVEHLSFDVMIKKISEMSQSKRVLVNKKPDQQLSVTVVETKGWGVQAPYVYFNFVSAGKGWRWTGSYSCGSRDEDIARIRGKEMSDSDAYNGTSAEDLDSHWISLVNGIRSAFETKNFELLKVYLPKGPIVKFGRCGPGDSGFTELSIDTVQKLLIQQLNGSNILFNPPPNTEVNLVGGHVFIETEGWIGEYPYLGFGFSLLQPENTWVWTGVCDSSAPQYDARAGSKYEPHYVREPRLPRPGPRVFKDDLALRDRLHEILLFKKLEAFHGYAVKDFLAFGICQADTRKKLFTINGYTVPAKDVIEFLKTGIVKYPVSESSGLVGDSFEDARGFIQSKLFAELPSRYRGAPGKPIFESKIVGPYPYAVFWANQVNNKWEWSGVSYCKAPQQSMLFPDEPRSHQNEKKLGTYSQ